MAEGMSQASKTKIPTVLDDNITTITSQLLLLSEQTQKTKKEKKKIPFLVGPMLKIIFNARMCEQKKNKTSVLESVHATYFWHPRSQPKWFHELFTRQKAMDQKKNYQKIMPGFSQFLTF